MPDPRRTVAVFFRRNLEQVAVAGNKRAVLRGGRGECACVAEIVITTLEGRGIRKARTSLEKRKIRHFLVHFYTVRASRRKLRHVRKDWRRSAPRPLPIPAPPPSPSVGFSETFGRARCPHPRRLGPK